MDRAERAGAASGASAIQARKDASEAMMSALAIPTRLTTTLFGPDDDAVVKMRISLWVFPFVLGLDGLTKTLAVWLLPADGTPIPLYGDVELTLILNEKVVAASQRQQLQVAGWSMGFFTVWCASAGILALIALRFARSTWPAWQRLAVIPVVLASAALPAWLLQSLMPDVEPRTTFPLRVSVVIVLSVLLLRLVRHRVMCIAVALLFAGSLANSLNGLLYPPGIVDFLLVPVLSANVVNLADLVLMIGKWLLMLGFLIALVQKLRDAPRSAPDGA